ncbi:MAG: hypothetical protein GXO36_00275 [Chloroflexi bacterium]|nr:hypothetical protein [Chloroflexota bacterium]
MHREPPAARALRTLARDMALAAIGLMAARIALGPDTWWHLRTGKWVWQHKAWPATDPFSYTRYGHPWNPPGPPVQVLMYGLYRGGGIALLDLGVTLLVVATFAWIWPLTQPHRGQLHPLARAGLLVWAAATSAIYWAARPYLVTFLFTAITLYLLERDRRGQPVPGWPFWLLAMMLVWANSHGGFIVGLLVVLAYAVPDLLRSLVRMKLARAGRTLPWGIQPRHRVRFWAGLILGLLGMGSLTPVGPARWLYPFQTVGIRALQQYIAEWQAPSWDQPTLWPFWAWWLALPLLVLAGWRRWPSEHSLLWFGFGLLALQAVRNVALFALVAPMALASPLARALAWAHAWWTLLRGPRRPRAAPPVRVWVNRALVALLVLAGLAKWAAAHQPARLEAYLREAYPVGAVAYIRQTRPPGRMFNSYNWGGYLLWHLPEYPVFVDGRTDLYGDEILSQWLDVVRGQPNWSTILDRWDVNFILLEREFPIHEALARSPDWVLVYEDGQARVWVRTPAATSSSSP